MKNFNNFMIPIGKVIIVLIAIGIWEYWQTRTVKVELDPQSKVSVWMQGWIEGVRHGEENQKIIGCGE